MTVPSSLDGERLDKALAELAALSRSAARRLIEAEDAGIDGQDHARPRDPVHTGATVWYRIPANRGPFAEDLAIGVAYEDEHLAVVDKPSGMVTHPGPGLEGGTLVSAILHRWPQIEGVGEHPRWGIVHRLDRETSGLLVVAKTRDVHRRLAAQIKERTVERIYWSLVHGHFEAGTGTIEAPIERVKARQTVSPTGRPAITHYRRLAEWRSPDLTLLEVRLETGRTHQIRVHLESIEHHVVGDRVYGRRADPGIDPGRVWLHAKGLGFAHPVGGVPVDASSQLPADLAASLDVVGPPAGGEVPGRVS